MATLRLYNTMTRRLEVFHPLDPARARLYACGPTVYARAHIGNFRTFLFVDLLRRTLGWFGFNPEHVMNLTDVDDKTIRGAQKAGKPLGEFTQPFIDGFLQDMETLRLLRPQRVPRATDYIQDVINLIQTLVDRGHAYRSDDGSVYFRVTSDPHYGCLAHLDREGLKPGARVEHDEYQKESIGDFALWKAWVPEDGEVGWDSPWGRGRPGWHIECSAMSMRLLGEQFDIHCGGIDLLFPHHENERAQSESATGKKFVQIWMHSAHLQLGNEKMSKSLGNLLTIPEVLAKGYQGRHLRYALLGSHYQQNLTFSLETLDAARVAIGRIDEWIARIKNHLPGSEPGPEAQRFLEKFGEALAEDLNVPKALGILFEFIHETNRLMDQGASVPGLYAAWQRADQILALEELEEALPPEIQALLDRRAEARKNKDFSGSDKLRQELDQLGWMVKDTPKGQVARRK